VIARTARFLRDRWQLARDPVGYARRIGVTVGEGCLLAGLTRGVFGTEPYLITVGDRVGIASGVRMITHDGGAFVFRNEFPNLDTVGRITIGDDVVIGMNVILLPGTTVGSYSVVGAGAVVSGTVPPGCVYAGVPARFVCTTEEYRERTLQRAIFVADLPHAERRSYYERFLDGEIDGHGNPLPPADQADPG